MPGVFQAYSAEGGRTVTVKMFVVRMIELCKAEEEAGRCPRDSEGNQCPLYRFHCGIPEEKSEIDLVCAVRCGFWRDGIG